jgi:transcriptional regulator with XRE-family HTH domain
MDNVVPLRRRPEPEPLWREAVGKQLRDERRQRGERIADVAGRAGVSPQYLSEIERGVKDASSEVLAALAGALGLRMLDLTQRSTSHLGVRVDAALGGPVCMAA